MIGSIRHKGLRRLYEDDDRKLVPPELAQRIREILTALEAAENPRRVELHPLKGEWKGF